MTRAILALCLLGIAGPANAQRIVQSNDASLRNQASLARLRDGAGRQTMRRQPQDLLARALITQDRSRQQSDVTFRAQALRDRVWQQQSDAMVRVRLTQDRIRQQQSEMMFRTRLMQDRIREQQSEMMFRARAMQDRIRDQQSEMMFRTRAMQDRIRLQQADVMARRFEDQSRAIAGYQQGAVRSNALQQIERRRFTQLQTYASVLFRRTDYLASAQIAGLRSWSTSFDWDMTGTRTKLIGDYNPMFRAMTRDAGRFRAAETTRLMSELGREQLGTLRFARALTLGSAGAQTLSIGFDLWTLRQINRGGKIFDIGDDLKIRWRTARPYDAPLGVGLAYRLLVAAPNPFRERGSYSARVVTSGGVTRWESIR